MELTKVLKLEPDLLSYSLSEVIERFADDEFLNRDIFDYNSDWVAMFTSEVKRLEKEIPLSSAEDHWSKAIAKLKLPPEIVLMYGASLTTASLRTVCLVTRSEGYFAVGPDEAEEAAWFFDKIIERHGLNSLVPLIFLQRNRAAAEDFNLSPKFRRHLLSILLSRLKSMDQFKAILNSFAEDQPYFRLYPII